MATTSQDRSVLTGNRVATALIVSGVVTILTLGAAFALLALDFDYFWVAFPLGFGGVLPIALGFVALATAAD